MSDPNDPTRPIEPVPPADPTRQMPTQSPPVEPTERVITTTTRREDPPPSSRGISGGGAAAIAIGAAALALLIGFLVWGQDDDDGAIASDVDTTEVEDNELEDTVPLEDESDTEELESQVDDLGAQLDDATNERDDLQAQLEEIEEGRIELGDLVGSPIEDVRDLASENGWELVEQEPDDTDDAETDVVLSQSPSPGTIMIEGSLLLVEVVTS